MNAAVIDPPVGDSSLVLDERISALLISRGRLKEADVNRARRLYDEDPKGSFVMLLARLGLISERDLVEAAAEVLHLPMLSAKECPDSPPASVQVSVKFL